MKCKKFIYPIAFNPDETMKSLIFHSFIVITHLIFLYNCEPVSFNSPCDPESKNFIFITLATNSQNSFCNQTTKLSNTSEVPSSSSTFSLGGTAGGLTRTGLVLSSGTTPNEVLSISSNATSFTFSNKLNQSSSYNVTITSQPSGNTCVLTNGSGTISANVTNLTISCETVNTLYLVDQTNGMLYFYNTGNSGVLSSNGSIATSLTSPYLIMWNGKHLVLNGGNTFRSYMRNLDGTLSFANSFTATTTPVLPQGTSAFHSSGKFFYYTVNTASAVTSFSKLQMDGDGQFFGETNIPTTQNWTVMGPIHPTGNYFMTFHSSSAATRRFYSITDLNTGTIGSGLNENSIPDSTLNPANGHCIFSLNANHLYCANISNSGNNGKIVQMSVTSNSNTLLSPPDLLVQNNTVWESPKSLVLHPSGNYIFAYGNTNIYSYAVNQSTGIINPTPVSSMPTPGGGVCTTSQGVSRLAIHPNGNMLYATCVKPNSSNHLGAYPVSSSGELSAPTLTLVPGTTSNLNLYFVQGN